MHRDTRHIRRLLAPTLLAAAFGCTPVDGGGGCEPPPHATDAVFRDVHLVNTGPPCSAGTQVTRGSGAHLWVNLDCPGTGDAFLVAVSVDGRLVGLERAEPAGYGTGVYVDAGPWEAPDSLRHRVDVVIDPLNLFPETDETNNRGGADVRMVDPDASIDAARCGFVVPYPQGDGWSLVDHVPAGVEVEAHLWLTYGGGYPQIVRSVRSGTAFAAGDTVAYLSCDQPGWQNESFSPRWTPPGPGVYTVEFRITPLGSLPNRTTNDVVVRQLTVIPAVPPVMASRGGITR